MIKLLKKFAFNTFYRTWKYENSILNKNCTEFEVNNWIVSDFVLKKLIPVIGIKPFPLNELFFMTTTVLKFNPTHIFEWGTHIGKSARIFYEIIKSFNIKCEIHSVDLPDEIHHIEHPKNKRGKLVRGIKEVHLHQGDGLDISLKIYKEINGECRPLFFLDGDHSYESVKRELEGITKEVSNPIILVHDTFYQSKESNYNIGPYKAIQDITLKYPNKYKVNSPDIGLPGMSLLYINNRRLKKNILKK